MTDQTSDLDALRREIAERLGYEVKSRGRLFELVSPDGRRSPNFGAEWAAWSATPDWTRDCDAALALLDGLFWNAWGGPRRSDLSGNYRFMIEIGDRAITFSEHLRYEGAGKTFAEAICRAWLKWAKRAERTEG